MTAAHCQLTRLDSFGKEWLACGEGDSPDSHEAMHKRLTDSSRWNSGLSGALGPGMWDHPDEKWGRELRVYGTPFTWAVTGKNECNAGAECKPSLRASPHRLRVCFLSQPTQPDQHVEVWS